MNQSHNKTISNDVTSKVSSMFRNHNSILNNNKMTHINSTTNSTGNPNVLNTNLNQMSTNRSSDFVNSEFAGNNTNIITNTCMFQVQQLLTIQKTVVFTIN